MADDDDKKWWKDKEKLQPGAIGAAIGVAVCAAGIWIKNKKDEKDEEGRGRPYLTNPAAASVVAHHASSFRRGVAVSVFSPFQSHPG